jgi:hypothetical protein
MIVVVEILNNLLYKLFALELLNMNIGYNLNISNVHKMIDIVNAIDYIKRSKPEDSEIIKIVEYYGTFE